MITRPDLQRFGCSMGAIFLIALADVTMKMLIMDFLLSHNTSFYPVFHGFNLNVVWNTGISFGLFPALPSFVLLMVTGGVVVGLLVWLYKTEQTSERWALCLIIGGALGNMRDRILYGAVYDFLDVYVGSYHWPAFNLADSCIVVGVFLLLYRQIVPKQGG